jgi:hypothetical protein
LSARPEDIVRVWAFACSAVVALVLAACSASNAESASPEAAALQQPVETPELMVHVIEPAARNFWKGWGAVLDEKGWRDVSPKTEAEWKIVEDGAATAVIAATLLKQDAYAREPLDKWNAHAQRIVDLMQAGREGAERQDTETMFTLGEQLDEACDACHADFAPHVP